VRGPTLGGPGKKGRTPIPVKKSFRWGRAGPAENEGALKVKKRHKKKLNGLTRGDGGDKAEDGFPDIGVIDGAEGSTKGGQTERGGGTPLWDFLLEDGAQVGLPPKSILGGVPDDEVGRKKKLPAARTKKETSSV